LKKERGVERRPVFFGPQLGVDDRKELISAVEPQSRLFSIPGYAKNMGTPGRSAGFTLIEVIVALLIFAVGALALAASSALIAQAMATNGLRERSGRVAASTIALIRSQCGTAVSGSERVQQMESAWWVTRFDRSRLGITESVSYPTPRGPRTQTYRATVWCRH
jgi:prepilin-type N-terminal cleavage/methylation domain-containing protein